MRELSQCRNVYLSPIAQCHVGIRNHCNTSGFLWQELCGTLREMNRALGGIARCAQTRGFRAEASIKALDGIGLRASAKLHPSRENEDKSSSNDGAQEK